MDNLIVTEYQNQRVLTTRQIADAYGTESQVITNNYNRNKERYLEGKHYISLTGEALKAFKSANHNELSLKRVNQLYLWTEKGTFLHAKSLNTDVAWEVYDRLVDTYFQKQNFMAELSPEVKAIFEVDKRITQVDSKVEAVKKDLQDFKKELPILGIEIDQITDAVHKRGVDALCGRESNAYNHRSLRAKVYADIYRELKRQFGVNTYKAIKRNQCDIAITVIAEYELPYVLTEQINDCNAQINMEVV